MNSSTTTEAQTEFQASLTEEPPKDNGELSGVDGGDKGDDSQEKKDDTQSQRLVSLGLRAVLFHDPEKSAWARVPVQGHHEVCRIDSKAFTTWLIGEYYAAYNSVPSQNSTTGALLALQAKAVYEGNQHEVFTRYAYQNNAIYLDLCNTAWQSVKVSDTGWQIQAVSDVMFRRASKSLPLPEPLHDGSINDLRHFLNRKITDPEFVLIKAFLLGSLQPAGSFVHLDLEGEKGSGKSTTTRVIRELIDPVRGALLPIPKSEQDLTIAASTSRILSYDNLSGLSANMSDALCRLSTGGGFAGRKLYTDDDESIIEVKRPVIFNGIDSIATKPDLLDRCIVINLQEITDSARIDEETFWLDYEQQKPFILGALLTAASQALKNRNSVKLSKLPRMADFTKWVVAAQDALSFQGMDFTTIYGSNRDEATDIALEADALAGAIKVRLDRQGSFAGGPAYIVKELAPYLDCKPTNMPTERTIRKRLLTLKPSLRKNGVEIEITPRTKTGHIITVKSGVAVADEADLSSSTSPSPDSITGARNIDDDLEKDIVIASSPWEGEPGNASDDDVDDDEDLQTLVTDTTSKRGNEP
ncbi:hypothetical protein KA183_06790 [bacterium]|nr:hypothetical protein [bacterium]